ncbi:DEAD-box ATP-dependent RNA helicase CshC-like [Sycon ciliatum]|uniref:DEAD-box ATP-dependent RNA helicase CshC-like n=1 Tax=Sycon ciliatum TaxID=27933 RepID=UPI0020AADE97|eukprot:scpid19081/ scgid23364/ ATP-dependent RNA helicase dbp10
MAYTIARQLRVAATSRCWRYASSGSAWSPAVSSVSKTAVGAPNSTTFEGLGITNELCDGLKKKLAITQPNAVQMKSIPHLLEGRDLMIQSETGSGKTLSFLLPILQKSKHVCSTLIIVPTRELAVQTLHVVNSLKPSTEHGPFAVALVSGLETYFAAEDVQKLAPRVLIATPKRLLEVMNVAPQLFYTVQHVVLDEVDRLVPTAAPSRLKHKNRFHPKPTMVALTLLREELLKGRASSLQLVGVSATLSHSMRAELLDLGFSEKARLVYMQDRIAVPETIRHRFALYNGAHRDKAVLLTQIFNSLGAEQALVFIHNGAPIDGFVYALKKQGILAEALYSHQADPESLDSYAAFLKDFEDGHIQMVVANEATVRGLDFPFVKHVILLEVPPNPATYVHLAGRASRHGQEGFVTVVACPEDESFGNLEHIYRKLNINATKVAPELLDIGECQEDEEGVWDQSSAVILRGEDKLVPREEENGEEQDSQQLGSGKERKKASKFDEHDDDEDFDLKALGSDDEVRKLLHSKHAVPVMSDLPYDTVQLGQMEMRPDGNESIGKQSENRELEHREWQKLRSQIKNKRKR